MLQNNNGNKNVFFFQTYTSMFIFISIGKHKYDVKPVLCKVQIGGRHRQQLIWFVLDKKYLTINKHYNGITFDQSYYYHFYRQHIHCSPAKRYNLMNVSFHDRHKNGECFLIGIIPIHRLPSS